MTHSTLIQGNSGILDILSKYLNSHDLGVSYAIEVNDNISGLQIEGKHFDAPVYLGQVLDYLIAAPNRINVKETLLTFNGGGTLDITSNIFTNAVGKTALLTEKEVALLRFLHAQKGKSITRKELLEQIWEYADGVETHTLETHIYRLRQKIEKDPAKPEILQTTEDGYRV